ncbi:MAG: hypothetical protein AB7N76_14330 [Planctomycetota bacterium]
MGALSLALLAVGLLAQDPAPSEVAAPGAGSGPDASAARREAPRPCASEPAPPMAGVAPALAAAEQQVAALRRLRSAGEAVAAVASAGDPQARALALTALQRFPGDREVRALLLAISVDRQADRGERALALDLLARGGYLASAREPLRALRGDADPLIRAAAERLFAGAPR